jgi:hypothetical protein
MTAPASGTTRRGGPPPAFFLIAVIGLLAGVGLTVLSAMGAGTGPAASPTVAPAGQSAAATARAVVGALGARSIQAGPAQRPYRPAESPTITGASRSVLQAVLPDDPDHGYIVIYELPTPDAAAAAGREFAEYLGTGPGRIQFPTDTRFTLRQVGDTLVFFDWSPANWPDERSATIQQALETLGTAIPIAR